MRTVSEIAELAGVTVRTLHHYDEIGLVVPSDRTDAGYRLYAASDLERLQLVLSYRESRRRTADYTKQDWEDLKAESEAIMRRLGEVYRSGAPADSEAAMDAVEADRPSGFESRRLAGFGVTGHAVWEDR